MKGNWLLGGNASFSSVKSSNTLGVQQNSYIQIAGNAGYFFISKLAAGVRPTILWSKTKNAPAHNNSIRSTLGPFLRYYFLPADSRVNVFAEGNYTYVTDKAGGGKAHANKYAFLGGPVIFLNSAVGLEFSIGYSLQKSTNNNFRIGIFQTGIGLQFHLIKDDQ